MKANYKYPAWIVVVTICIATGQATAQVNVSPLAAPALTAVADKTSYKAGALAATDRRNWLSFLKLAEKPNADVVPEDIENAFGQKMKFNKKTGEYSISGVLKYLESETPKFRNLYPERKQVDINFIFLDKDFLNRCPDRARFISDLQGAGWKLHLHESERSVAGVDNSQLRLPARDIFLKGDQGILDFTYINGCPDAITMRADKLSHDEAVNNTTTGGW